MTNRLASATRLLLAYALLAASAYATEPFDSGDQPAGWVGEVELSSFNLSSGSETIYKSDYVRADWSGNLRAFPVSAAGVVNYSSERWTGGAAARIDAQNFNTGRFIVTMKSGGTGSGTGIPFRWADLGNGTNTLTAQQTSIGDATTGPKILNYVRGDTANQSPSGADYRRRNTKLGAIVHSRPLYVYDAANPRIYVGANDGMLHAFNPSTGAEVFAYVPSMLIPRLKYTTVDGDPYRLFFVDGSPNARRVKLSGVGKTILAGGLGAGGTGLYALDISSPTTETEASAKSRVLWEITNASRNNNAGDVEYPDLGNTYGVPLIVKVNTGTEDWAAIVGNGYNSVNGKSVLYVINLADGSLVKAIETSEYGTAGAPSGLSSPTAVDVNGDSKIDYVYAGDIDGRLWKFDLSSTDKNAWSTSKLFTTADNQAITGAPSVALHSLGGYMVTFATGRLFTEDDLDDLETHYVYGLRDNGTAIDPANVVAQTLTAATFGSYDVRTSSSNAVNYAGGKQGWSLALPAGERVVGDGGLITNGRYIVATTNPTVQNDDLTIGGTVYRQAMGENWLIEVAHETGGGGALPVFDLNNDGALNDSDLVTASNASIPATKIPVARLISTGIGSQPVVAQLTSLSKTFFNANMDLPPPSTGGVTGGHFDFDNYWAQCTVATNKYSCPNIKHVHEYDDKYNVTGVNMLAASLSIFNLGGTGHAIPSTTTKFKVLMANQKLSPAVEINVGLKVAAGAEHTCAATNGAGVKCWGNNGSGQLGDGTTASRPTAADVSSIGAGVVAITAGDLHTCALTTLGGVKCWGENGNGQLGDATTTDRSTPVAVSGLDSGVAAIAAGGSHTCALTTTGAVKCWGLNGNGQLGNNTTNSQTTPVDVTNLASGVTAIAAGTGHTCAVAGGSVKCWGQGGSGQLGNNATADALIPVTVQASSSSSGALSGITAVAAGEAHTCAVTATGGVKCWGQGSDGQLGDGNASGRPTPGDVGGLTGVIGIEAGGNHSCAGTSAWGVKCWGKNENGQLGDGSTTRRMTPVDMTGLTGLTGAGSKVTALAAGGSHSCAALYYSASDAWVKCTGSNGSGRLGDGSQTDRSTPVAVRSVNAYTTVPQFVTPPADTLGTSDTAFVSTLPTYTLSGPYTSSGLLAFAINMPLDAFESKVWVTGDIVRAGLVPTQTGCVHANKYGLTTGGAWMNGALTIQVIKDTTTDAAIELNVPDDPSMGYRLKADATSQLNQLAQYTVFWHHPNRKCYGDAGWVPNPPQDFGASSASIPPDAGSADPAEGTYGAGSGTTTTGPTSAAQTFYVDGTFATQTATSSSSGNTPTTVTRFNNLGSTIPIPPPTGGPQSDSRKTGKLSWKELVRQ